MRRSLVLAGVLALASTGGCLSYSSYQDAHIAERGKSQGTVALSYSTYRNAAADEAWYPIEINPRFALGDRFDMGVKMSVLFSPAAEFGWVLFGADVRAGVIPDYLALTLPVAFSLGASPFETLQVQPGLIVTLPLAENLDLNGSARYHTFVGSADWNAWAYNVSLGIRVSPEWTLRPEVGWLIVPRESNGSDNRTVYTEIGLGVTATKPTRSGKPTSIP